MKRSRILTALALIVFIAPLACTSEEAKKGADEHMEDEIVNDGKIALPLAVRQNLGIEWSVAEKRVVSQTQYFPATVEAPPEATQNYQALFRGRVTLHVERYQSVKAGELLATIKPFDIEDKIGEILTQGERVAALRAALSAQVMTTKRLQAQALRNKELVALGEKQIASHVGHRKSLEAESRLVTDRLVELEGLAKKGGGLANEIAAAKLEVAAKASALAEVAEEIADATLDNAERRAETKAIEGSIDESEALALSAQRQLDLAKDKTPVLLRQIGVGYGKGREWLRNPEQAGETLSGFEGLRVLALSDGVVSSVAVSEASIVEANAAMLSILDPSKLLLRAHQPQADVRIDLTNYKASAELPSGKGKAIAGSLFPALEAEGDQRLSDLIFKPKVTPAWLRAGLAMRLEVTPRATADTKTIAIEQACIIQDGLEMVYFLRDANDPDKVMRMVADSGVSDGRWVEIRSGLALGAQVVRKGVYELKLASSSQVSKGGHFHADGTWHEGEH